MFAGGRGKLEMDVRGLLVLSWAKGITVEVADALASLAAVEQMTGGKPTPILIRTKEADVAPEAALLYRATLLVSAVALVGKTPVDRVIAAKMHRDRACPHAFFTDEEHAADWLLLHRNDG